LEKGGVCRKNCKRCRWEGTDLLLLLGLSTTLSTSGLLALALLQESLGDEDMVLGRDGAGAG
jgi:hypothetical protein